MTTLEDKKIVVKPVSKEAEKKPQQKGVTLGDLLAAKGQSLKAKK